MKKGYWIALVKDNNHVSRLHFDKRCNYVDTNDSRYAKFKIKDPGYIDGTLALIPHHLIERIEWVEKTKEDANDLS